MVQITIQTDKADTAAVSTPVMMLDVGDQLHGPYFGGSAQRAGGEGIDVGLYRVAIGVDLAAHTGYEVDDVAVVLYLLIEIHLHVVGIPA